MESCGNNVKFEVRGDKLVIEIDLKAKGVPSKSGKSVVIGTTSGFARTTAKSDGRVVKIGLNAIIGD